MISASNASKNGFTLIELLVVLVIMSTTMALVGGVTFDAYKKYQLKAHKMRIHSVMRKASDAAFINETSLLVEYSGNAFTLKRTDKTLVDSFEFEDVEFESGSIAIERTGFFTAKAIAFRHGDKRHTILF